MDEDDYPCVGRGVRIGVTKCCSVKQSSSYFSNVEFPKKAEGKDYYPIIWSGALKGFTLQQDMYLILPESEYPKGYQTLAIFGAMDLNGHTLTIPGNVMHTDGQVSFRGGKLDVRGNYEAKRFSKLDNDGNPIYTTGSGTLRMADAADGMQVAGDVQPGANVSINNAVITNKADGTVTVKNTKTVPNVDITLKLPEKNMVLVVSQDGEITIPLNTELTMPARKDKIILPRGGTADASGVVRSGHIVVGDLSIEAQENTFISVSPQGEITIPKGAVLTDSDGTKTQLPEGGIITADGELTEGKTPDGEESGSDGDEWHYPEEVVVSSEVKVRDLKTDARAEIVTKIKAKVYNGNAYTPAVKVTAYNENGKKTTLTAGADYRVKYKNNVNAGDAVVIIEGNGAYKGSIEREFKISKKPVKKLKIASGTMIEGNTIELDSLPVQVYDGAKQLKYGVDYTLAVSGGTVGSSASKGKLTVTVTAGSDSNYTGSRTVKIKVCGKLSKNFKVILCQLVLYQWLIF